MAKTVVLAPLRRPNWVPQTALGHDTFVRTAEPFELVPSHVAHATDLVEHVVERISKNDAGIDGFRHPAAGLTTPKTHPFGTHFLAREFSADDVL